MMKEGSHSGENDNARREENCWWVFLGWPRGEGEMSDVRSNFLAKNSSSPVAGIENETMAVLHASLGSRRWKGK